VKIAIEYDGLHHFMDRSQRVLDVARNANLTADGWKVIVVLDHHLFQQPELTIMRVLDALHERGHPGAPRRPTDDWRAHFA
jgi:very-short-patch-repair endonuclease